MLHKLTTARLFVLLLFISIFVMAVRAPVDTDMWWHLAAGRQMWHSHSILSEDPFSHTVLGKRWTNHSWLSQLIFYALYKLGGLQAIALATALAITLAWWVAYRQTEGNPYVRGFSLLLAALASSVMWTPRPLIFTFLLFAVLNFLLERGRRNSRWLWLLPPLFMLWGNLHAGYIGGFVLLGCRLLGLLLEMLGARRFDGKVVRLAGICALCIGAILINPHGYKVLLYPFATVKVGPLRKYIQEWTSPDFHQLFVQPFIWLLLATFGAVGFSGQRMRGDEFIPLAVFCYLSLIACRNIPLFALVAGPILAHYARYALSSLSKWAFSSSLSQRFVLFESPRPGSPFINSLLLALLLLAALLKVTVALAPSSLVKAEKALLPVGAVKFLREEHVPGNMFNDYNWGGYLIWQLYPEYKVFVDGRTTLYGEEVLGDYLRVMLVKTGWEDVLDKYNVSFILVKQDSTLARWLEREPTWHKAYEDRMAVVFRRKGP